MIFNCYNHKKHIIIILKYLKKINRKLNLFTQINFYKFFNFLKPFFIAKRFQTSKNTLEALKTAGSVRTRKPLKRLDLNFISVAPQKLICVGFV